jgi:hypothetical protein
MSQQNGFAYAHAHAFAAAAPAFFQAGQQVSFVVPPSRSHVKAIFARYDPSGHGVVQIAGWNPFGLPPGSPMLVPLQCITAIQPKASLPKVGDKPTRKVERPAPVPAPAPAPAPASDPAPAPAPAPADAAPALSAEDAKALEEGAKEYLLTQIVYQTTRANLSTRMKDPVGQYSVNVPCSAFTLVSVGGVPRRASIGFALGKNVADIRSELLRRLGYVPERTFVRFEWMFDRDEAGKPLDKQGKVVATFTWGKQKAKPKEE